MKQFSLTFLLLSIVTGLSAQSNGDYQSQQDGFWNDVSTWQVFNGGWQDLSSVSAGVYQNVIPTSASGAITILNGDNVNIPNGFSVSINQTTIAAGGILTVANGGVLTVLNSTNALVVNGELIGENNSSITNTAATNITFNAGSVYEHRFTTTQGVIPRATWNTSSTLEITGYTTFTSATVAGNWVQTFGNVIWNCSGQTSTVALNTLLRSVTGNFDVLNTNTGLLQLSSTQTSQSTLTFNGNFSVIGSSRIAMTTTANRIVNIGGDFTFSPTNSSVSTLGTTATTTVNIAGDFEMDAAGSTLYLANSTGSTGTGRLYITGDFRLQAGTITEGINDSATSNGNIFFYNSGTGKKHFFENNGTISNRINYRLVYPQDTLHVVNESQLIGNTGSTFTLSGGVMIVESTHADGAIQLGSGTGGGNIRTASRTFLSGSRIVYMGDASQVIGNGHSTSTSVVVDNPSGVSLNHTTLATVSMENLTINQGSLSVVNNNLAVNGSSSAITINGGSLIVNTNVAAKVISINDLILAGGDAFFTSTSNAITVTVNGDISLPDGDITMTNSGAAAIFNTYGDINLTSGNIIVNSGTANSTLTIRGDLTGAGNFQFTGNNTNINIFGSGVLSRDFPLVTATFMENLVINRASSTVNFPVDLSISNNFSIQDGNVVMAGNLLVVGDLNVATGDTLFFEDHTLELRSQFNNVLFGGRLSANSGSVLELTGSGNVDTLFFSASGNTLGRFVLDRPTSGTLVKLNDVLTITDSLLLEDGIMENISGLTFAEGATLKRNFGGFVIGATPLGGPYNLVYTGASMPTGPEALGALANIVSNSTGTITLTGSVAATDSLKVNTGTFTTGSHNISVGTFFNQGVFNAPTSPGVISVSANFINDGTFNRNTSTVAFTGATEILGSSNPTFHSVTISNGSSLLGPDVLQLTGHFNNDGTFDGGNGTVIFSGSSLQNFTGSSAANFYNIQITNTTAPVSVSMENSATVSGVLTLGASVDLDADGSANTSILRFLSLDDEPTEELPVTGGSIAAIPSTSSVIGNVTTERFMGAKGNFNRYISSPVTGATVASLQDDFNTKGMRYYDETVTGGFSKGYKEVFGVLQPGRGYLAYMWDGATDKTWDVSGPLTPGSNQGDVVLPVTHTSSTPADPNSDGWNLVGNPYPSAIQWNNDLSDWQKTNIAPIIYVPDVAAGVDRTWNANTQTGDLPNGIIASGQAFWVYASANGASLTVREQAKTSSSGTFFRDRPNSIAGFKLSLTYQERTDNSFLIIKDDATRQFDPAYDGLKLEGRDFGIALVDDNSRKLVSYALSEDELSKHIPLSVQASDEGEVLIEISTLNGAANSQELYLVDTYKKTVLPLNAYTSYGMRVTHGDHTKVNRLFLTTNPERLLAEEYELEANVYPNPAVSSVTVEINTDQVKSISLIDNMGKVLEEVAFSTEDGLTRGELQMSEKHPGFYFIKITGSDMNSFYQKIVKK